MLAVFQTGGKQYRVAPGDEIKIEKIPGKAGDSVKFDKVLALEGDETIKIGDPLLEGMEVAGEILKQDKAKKIIVFKFKRRKKYRKKQGHRQCYTQLKITHIGSPPASKVVSEQKEEEVPVSVEGEAAGAVSEVN